MGNKKNVRQIREASHPASNKAMSELISRLIDIHPDRNVRDREISMALKLLSKQDKFAIKIGTGKIEGDTISFLTEKELIKEIQRQIEFYQC